MLEFVKENTSRGGRLAIFHEYEYNWKRFNKSDSTEYWNCRRESENGVSCSASITTFGDQVVKIKKYPYNADSPSVVDGSIGLLVESTHNHKANKTQNNVAIEGALANMVLRASNENIAAGEIYRQEQIKLVQKLGESAAASLPPLRSCQNRIYKAKHSKFPNLPKSLHDFTINQETNREWGESLVDQRRLLLQNSSIAASDRSIIFSSDEQIKCLASCSRWGADGTFASAPPWFYQVINYVHINEVV
jgi:hypothetical protein